MDINLKYSVTEKSDFKGSMLKYAKSTGHFLLYLFSFLVHHSLWRGVPSSCAPDCQVIHHARGKCSCQGRV